MLKWLNKLPANIAFWRNKSAQQSSSRALLPLESTLSSWMQMERPAEETQSVSEPKRAKKAKVNLRRQIDPVGRIEPIGATLVPGESWYLHLVLVQVSWVILRTAERGRAPSADFLYAGTTKLTAETKWRCPRFPPGQVSDEKWSILARAISSASTIMKPWQGNFWSIITVQRPLGEDPLDTLTALEAKKRRRESCLIYSTGLTLIEPFPDMERSNLALKSKLAF